MIVIYFFFFNTKLNIFLLPSLEQELRRRRPHPVHDPDPARTHAAVPHELLSPGHTHLPNPGFTGAQTNHVRARDAKQMPNQSQ